MEIVAVIKEQLSYQKVNTKEAELSVTFTSLMSINDFNELMKKADDGTIKLKVVE